MAASTPSKMLQEVTKHLAGPIQNKDALLKTLKKAETALLEPEGQSSSIIAAKKLKDLIVQSHLIHHKDREVRLLVAVCLSEIIRIFVPDPPFSDDIFKDIFKLMVGTFLDLADTISPYYSRRLKILENFASVKCSVIMLDIGCEDLAHQIFKIFFSVVKDGNRGSVFPHMVAIMSHILEESASQPLFDIIFRNLVTDEKNTSFWLAISVIQSSTKRLEPSLALFLSSCSTEKDTSRGHLNQKYHGIFLRIYQYAPTVLTSVIPRLTEELLAGDINVRRQAVILVGKLLTLSRLNFCRDYRSVFVEFLKRFSDKSTEVRIAAVESVQSCPIPCNHINEASHILVALEGRLLDIDDKVRSQAVVSACDLAAADPVNFPSELLSKVVERLRDKMVTVRRTAMRKLLELYGLYCCRCSNGLMSLNDHYEQIPSCILLLCLNKSCKEFRPENMDLLLAEKLFQDMVPINHRMQHWVAFYSLFKTPQINVLRAILSQKKRLQMEMLNYLVLRDKGKENGFEEEKSEILECFRKLSSFFVDSSKAEDCFKKVHQMKNNSFFRTLLELIKEPRTAAAVHSLHVKFLDFIGKKDPDYDFFRRLSIKCSHSIFTPEHITSIFEYWLSRKSDVDKYAQPSVDLLLVILDYFPSFLKGSEDCLKKLCLQEISIENIKLLKILTKARPHVALDLSDIYPFLERMCIQGTRLESKYAVSTIASFTDSLDSCIFSDLCKKLTNSLHDGRYIPCILQSLGCISQYSPSTFKLYETPIRKFIHGVFTATYAYSSDRQTSLDDDDSFSSSCMLKVYGLKLIVRSFLPTKISKACEGLEECLNLLFRILQMESSVLDSLPSDIDKAHIRLASAKSILKLARRWDSYVSPPVFRRVIMVARDPSDVVRKLFLDKVYKLLVKHAIPTRYASVFAFACTDKLGSIQADSIKYLTGFLKEHDKKDRICQNSSIKDIHGTNLTAFPEYIIVFVVHVLACDSGFPPDDHRSAEIYADFCSPLVIVLLLLAKMGTDHVCHGTRDDTLSNVLSMFRAIKKSEDPCDSRTTLRLHVLSDIGIFCTKTLLENCSLPSVSPHLVLLPSSMFKVKTTNSREVCTDRTTFVDERFAKRILDVTGVHISMLTSSDAQKHRKIDETLFSADATGNRSNDLLNDRHIGIDEIISGRNSDASKAGAIIVPENIHHNEQMVLSSSMSNQRKDQRSSCDSALMAPSFAKCTYSESRANYAHTIENINFVASQSGHCSVEQSNEPLQSFKESGLPGELLIGHCIKLWSPIDNCYVRGTVTSHESETGLCKIIYDNGDVEILSLDDENWEAIEDELSADKDAAIFRATDSSSLDVLGVKNSNKPASRDEKTVNIEAGGSTRKSFSSPSSTDKKHQDLGAKNHDIVGHDTKRARRRRV